MESDLPTDAAANQKLFLTFTMIKPPPRKWCCDTPSLLDSHPRKPSCQTLLFSHPRQRTQSCDRHFSRNGTPTETVFRLTFSLRPTPTETVFFKPFRLRGTHTKQLVLSGPLAGAVPKHTCSGEPHVRKQFCDKVAEIISWSVPNGNGFVTNLIS